MDPVSLIAEGLGVLDFAIGLFEKYGPDAIAANIASKAEAAGRDVTDAEQNTILALQRIAESRRQDTDGGIA